VHGKRVNMYTEKWRPDTRPRVVTYLTPKDEEKRATCTGKGLNRLLRQIGRKPFNWQRNKILSIASC
jgi:hypothetical protein